MSEGKKPSGAGDLAMDTHEVGGHVLQEAEAMAGREVGEVSDEEIDRILSGDEVETGDSTREIDVRAFRRENCGPA